jgi:fructose-1,6-bisphosphatase/inositol monophosphatase family enzyme
VCQEAGALVVDARGRELAARGADDRRVPVAAATPELLEELRAARSGF